MVRNAQGTGDNSDRVAPAGTGLSPGRWPAARGPVARVRLCRVPWPAGCGDHPGDGRWRCTGADADRWRQEPVLPGPGAVPARHGAGGLAADCADGRPGRGPATTRRQCRGAAFRTQPGGRAASAVRFRRRPARPALCITRAAAVARDARPAVPAADLGHRHRRGALRVAVGTRVQAGISGAGRTSGGAARGATYRTDRDRRPAYPNRHPAGPGDARGRGAGGQLPPPQLEHRGQAQGDRAAPAHRLAGPAQGERGRLDRLLRQPQQDRACGAQPARARLAGDRVPCGDLAAGKACGAGALQVGRAGGGGGDDRLWHGDRPAGRAHRCASRHAGQP